MCKAHSNSKDLSALRTKRNSLIAKAVVTRIPTPDMHLSGTFEHNLPEQYVVQCSVHRI